MPCLASYEDEPPQRAICRFFASNEIKYYTPKEILKIINYGREIPISQGNLGKALSRLKDKKYLIHKHRGREGYWSVNGETGKELCVRYVKGMKGFRASPPLPQADIHRPWIRPKTKLSKDRFKILLDENLLTEPKENDRAKNRKLETDNVSVTISESSLTVVIYKKNENWANDVAKLLGPSIARECGEGEFDVHLAINKRQYEKYVVENEKLRICEDESVFGKDTDLEFIGKDKIVKISAEEYMMDRAQAVETKQKLLDMNNKFEMLVIEQQRRISEMDLRMAQQSELIIKSMENMGSAVEKLMENNVANNEALVKMSKAIESNNSLLTDLISKLSPQQVPDNNKYPVEDVTDDISYQ